MLDSSEVFNRIVSGAMTFDEFEEWVSEQRADSSEYVQQLMSEYDGYGE
ncbi:MAG: hypothetical protein PHC28_11755 [Flavobacterium sp.]|nr:hypothetical protein [Flavobacterium sp.]MDD5151128.1 hypothetical protein [Flavobacterium sp.]